MRTTSFAKDVAAILAAVLVVFGAAITDDRITLTEAVNMGIALVTAVGVYLVRNGGTTVAHRYARGIVAAVGAGLTLLASGLITDGVTLAEWTQIALAALGALGVVAFPDENSDVVDDLPPAGAWASVDRRGVVSLGGEPTALRALADEVGRHRSSDVVDGEPFTPDVGRTRLGFDPLADDVTFRPGATRREPQPPAGV